MKRKAAFQRTFAAQASFEKYGRKSKREQFLDQMNEVVPWARLLSLVEPHYPKAGNGRRPVGLEIMLRAYFVQQWFNLSDPGMEDALYDSASLRHFVGVDLGTAAAPDETTILRFRHLLEEHDLGGAMLDEVNHHLAAKGIRITTGTIVDATIIHAPSSTKNSRGERDPEMHQTKKGNQWYFGLRRTSAWIASKAWCIRCVRLRPVWPTARCLLTCYMARNARCGETPAIKDKEMLSARPLLTLRT